jgi:hypothetical protein
VHAPAFCCGLLALVSAATSESAKLELAIVGGADPSLRVQVRLIAENEGGNPATGGGQIETEAVAPGTVELDLAPHGWTLVAEADGYWSQPVKLAPGGADSTVRIELWQTGALQGKLHPVDREPLPEVVEILFRSIPGSAESDSVPADWILCPVAEDAWSCELPAGLLDVQVAAKGFVKQFFWDIRIRAGGTKDLGSIEMRRGSSVRGWVLTETGAPADGARIELSPRTAASQPDPTATVRLKDLAASAMANHRGFFQLLDMKPGAYVLVAEKENFAPSRTTVRVLEDEATVVANPPLTLFAPSSLEVYVDPPAPPGSGLWQAELVQFDSDYHRIGVFAEQSIPANGSWRLDNVPTGFFSLSLSSENGDRWFSHSLETGPDTGPVFLTVPVVEVQGTVRIGSEPLPARLSFGGKYGSQSVYLATDEEGEFSGLLPRPGIWEVAVEVEEPAIRREIQVEVEEGEPLDLAFPDTVVRGVVVDDAGEPVPEAIVRVRNIQQIQMSADFRSGDDGRFESVGLPIGRTVLMAEAFLRTSEPREVVLEEGREPPEVRLVVRKNSMLEGRVVSEDGSGVSGAKVTAIPVEALSMGGPILGTDAEGRFETDLPPGSHNVVLTVAAPGYAFRVLQIPLEETPLVVPVGHASGTLVLELPESLDLSRWDTQRPIIFHGGGVVSVYALRSWAAFHGQRPESESRLVVPNVEPGRYAACLAPLDSVGPLLAGVNPGVPCVAGDLAISAELTLSLRAASK